MKFLLKLRNVHTVHLYLFNNTYNNGMKKVIKKSKNQKLSKKNKKVVMISGGFDPIHIGHVRYMRESKKLGDILVVVINNQQSEYISQSINVCIIA